MNQKFLYEPLYPMYIHQAFGENQACVDLETGRKVILCDGLNPPVGFRSLYGAKGHTGIDLWAWHGQEVYCAQRGYVESVDAREKSGLDVKIVSTINGQAYRHIYEHLLGYQHKEGDYVETGQLIGWADNTGYSSGDHLHFEVQKWVNGKWIPIDPMEHMERIYAKDILKVNSSIKYLQEQVALLADRLADYLRRNKKNA